MCGLCHRAVRTPGPGRAPTEHWGQHVATGPAAASQRGRHLRCAAKWRSHYLAFRTSHWTLSAAHSKQKHEGTRTLRNAVELSKVDTLQSHHTPCHNNPKRLYRIKKSSGPRKSLPELPVERASANRDQPSGIRTASVPPPPGQ